MDLLLAGVFELVDLLQQRWCGEEEVRSAFGGGRTCFGTEFELLDPG